jgi:hypothetical protein
MTWTKEEDIASKKQGWAIFQCDDANKVETRILKLDEPEEVAEDLGFKFEGTYFPSDAAAVRHVKEQAANGDAMCIKALTFHRKRVKNP